MKLASVHEFLFPSGCSISLFHFTFGSHFSVSLSGKAHRDQVLKIDLPL
jgi:hypothetical protein